MHLQALTVGTFNRASQLVLAGALALTAVHCSGDDDQPSTASAVKTTTEHQAGDLQYTFPERGAFIEQGSTPTIDINGTGASPGLTINGQPATVNKDGSWSATITPVVGINVIKAADGEFANDLAFIYGHFVKFSDPLPQGIALNLGVSGVAGKEPVASLSSVTNLWLKGKNTLLSGLNGQGGSGSKGPVEYNYHVDTVKNGDTTVAFTPTEGGLNVVVTMKDVVATGNATGKLLVSVTKPWTAKATSATITGLAKLSVSSGAIKATIPNATTRLDGFHVDVSGLPGLADDWISDQIRPALESNATNFVKNEFPKFITLTLDGLGLPKQLDLKETLDIAPVPLDTSFDGVEFTKDGGSLTAAARFGATEYNGGQPGVRALGWLELSKPPAQKRPQSAAASVSLDTLNQLLLAVWGDGSLQKGIPDVANFAGIRVDPMLPPVITPGTSEGSLTLSLGEVNIDGTLNNAPFIAAATIIQEVTPSIDGNNLLVTPKGDANLAITWLKADDIPDTLRKTVEALAGGQLQNFLASLKLPIPSINLAGLGGGFAGQMLRLDQPTLTVDEAAARIDIAGTLKLGK